MTDQDRLFLIRRLANESDKPFDGADVRFLLAQIDACDAHAQLDALLGLRNYTNDGGCWCEAFDRGRSKHSAECQKARAVIAVLDPP